MGKINKEWHLANKMAKNPTHDERMKWHSEHAQYCMCREMTPKLQEQVKAWKQK